MFHEFCYYTNPHMCAIAYDDRYSPEMKQKEKNMNNFGKNNFEIFSS